MRLRAYAILLTSITLSSCTLFTSIDEIERDTSVDDPGSDAGGMFDQGNGDTGGVRVDMGAADSGRDTNNADMGETNTDMGTGDVSDLGPLDMAIDADASVMPDGGADLGDDLASNDADMGPGDICGDGIITGAEECEPLGVASCFSAGFDGGDVVCDPVTCKLDTTACYTCDYYFAPESGDDANSGTTAATPWQSRDRLQALLGGVSGVNPGERVCFRRGEVMRVTTGVDVARDGLPGLHIHLTGYGDPAAPRATLTNALSVPVGSWTAQGGGIYAAPFATAARWIWLGNDGTSNPASDATLSDGRFFWDGVDLFYRPQNGVLSGTVDVVVDDEVFDFDHTQSEYITVSGLAFDAVEHAIEIDTEPSFTARFLSIIDNDFTRTDDAIRIFVQGSDPTDIDIIGNRFSWYRHGIYSTHVADESMRNFRIEGNVFQQPERVDSTPITLRNPEGAVIVENEMHARPAIRSTVAIGFYSSANGKHASNLVSRNYIVGWVDGILFTGVGGFSVLEGNEISQNLLYDNTDGIQVSGCDVATGTDIAHNTIVSSSSDSIEVHHDCGFRIYGNLSATVSGTHVDHVARPTGAPAPVVNVADYNMYVPSGTFEAVPDTFTDFAGWQAAGYDANGVSAADARFSGVLLQSPEDFIPAATSAAIDAAVDRGFVVDFEGRMRPSGSGYDIGAWERQPGD